jgi:ATP-dependent DNA ligase
MAFSILPHLLTCCQAPGQRFTAAARTDITAAVAPHLIEPCLPSPREQPPTGPDWVHEIKHDGYRLMARRDPVSVWIRLLTRNGYDWASRYPLIVQAVNRLRARSSARGRI